MPDQRLATLRALLDTAPSPEAWEKLLTLLEDWPDADGIQVGLDYADAHMAHWPDALREAPATWLQVLLGEPKALIKRKWRRGQRAHPGLQLARIFRLKWRRQRYTSKALKQLKDVDALRHITTLELHGNLDGDDAIYTLAASQSFPSLRNLKLPSNDIGPQGVWDLTEAPFLTSLETLDLSYNPIGNEGARGIAQCESLCTLRHLTLTSTRIEAPAMRALAASEHLAQLEHLNISNNGWNLGAPFYEALCQATFAPTLKILDLSHSSLTTAHLKVLQQGSFAQLHTLILEGNALTDKDVQTALHHDAFPNLKHWKL